MYTLLFTRKARDQLGVLPRVVSKRIVEKLEALCNDPHAQDIRKLVGKSLYRLRVGDYRVIFDLNQDVLIIYIVKVGHRKNVY